MSAQLLSIQVGMPATHGADKISSKPWESGIFKSPVSGKIWLDTVNLAGDGQQDLQNHGGPFRAVLAYSAGHYPVWRAELNLPDFAYGAFGENFTVSDLDEETVYIGDVYRIGEAELQISQPRMPCWKLARRHGIKDLTARVHEHAWGGWYHRVLKPGYVEAGDTIEFLERPAADQRFNIRQVYDLMNQSLTDPAAVAALAATEALSPGWREVFAKWTAEAR